MDDRELLRDYVEHRSQDAFRQLVDRHLPMVYSAARRMVRDSHLAEDVAQSVFSAEEFKGNLTGDDATREAQAKQLSHVMQEATQAALADAGLSTDYQTLPILNFRNIASAEEAGKSLKVLDDIYARAAARAGSFLSAEELAKFAEFREAAIGVQRAALMMNRKMMSPGSN